MEFKVLALWKQKTPLMINLLGELALIGSFLPKKCRNFIQIILWKKFAEGARKLHSSCVNFLIYDLCDQVRLGHIKYIQAVL